MEQLKMSLHTLKVTHPYPNVTGQVSTAATPYSRIREVLDSNLGQNSAYPDTLRPSGKMPV
jgi:hypothetical protein